MSAVRMGAPLPWRTGTWAQHGAALRDLLASGSPDALQLAMFAIAQEPGAKTRQGRTRTAVIGGLASLLAQDPQAPLALAHTTQSDIKATQVIALVRGLGVLDAALEDPVLAERPFTEAGLTQVRVVTSDELESIFDLDTMVGCARRLALFLLRRARRASLR